MNGLIWTGIDYAALPVVETRLGVRRAASADIFQRLRVMESAARGELNRAS